MKSAQNEAEIGPFFQQWCGLSKETWKMEHDATAMRSRVGFSGTFFDN